MTMTEPEAPTEEHPPAEVVPLAGTLARVDSQLERAAAFALTHPGVAGVNEFLSLAMQSRIFAASPLAPKALRGNPHACFHVALLGRALGLSIETAAQLIDLIPDRDGGWQPSLSPQLINAQIKRLNLGRIIPRERSANRCVAVAITPDGVEIGETEFTWEDAQMAGLAGKDCQPGAHSAQCKSRSREHACNQGYITYPKRMMWWRAAGFCADDYFPEALLGLYSPEELGAVVDAEGRPIDPETVELPPGFEEAARPPDPTRELASEEVRFEIACRIAALPEESREALRERWKANSTLSGKSVQHLPISAGMAAKSILNGIETEAKRNGWNMEEAHATFAAELRELDTTPEADPPAPSDEGSTAPTATGEPPSGPVAGSEPDDASDGHDDDGDAPGAAEGSDHEFTEKEQAVIDEVREMKLTEVDAELRRLGEEVKGSGQERRGALAAAMIAGRP